MGLLDGQLQKTIGMAINPIMLDLVVRRPAALTQLQDGTQMGGEGDEAGMVAYKARGFVDQYRAWEKAMGIVEVGDHKILLLQLGLDISPVVGDFILISDGRKFRVKQVDSDPASVTWELRVEGVFQ